MKYRVRLTGKAEADVASVLEWFRDQQALAAGGKWYAALMKALDTLEMHPERCGLAVEADELGQEVRELLIGKRRGVYRLLFIVSGKAVEILRVWHGARDAVTRDDL